MRATELTDWLLAGPVWIQYRTRLDLLDEPADSEQVLGARREMLNDPLVKNLVDELAGWPGKVINSHKSAGHPIHKLTFIADIGLRADDPGVKTIINRVLEHRSPQGPFQALMNISPRYGGTGKDQWAWALCDTPLLLYVLAKFGLGEDERVRKAAKFLASLIRVNGWPCAVSPELGKFRGPGRKDDPCPYANLVMVKALAQMRSFKESEACRVGAETALELWAESRERHPYMFYMGTDFRKLKAPFVWYDILHVFDVLTRLPWLREDRRLLEMADIVRAKVDDEGHFTAESVWKAWSAWEFGQKREPSRWLTLLALRALKRT